MIKFTVAGIGPEGPFVIKHVAPGDVCPLVDKLAREGKHVLDSQPELEPDDD